MSLTPERAAVLVDSVGVNKIVDVSILPALSCELSDVCFGSMQYVAHLSLARDLG